MTTNTSFGNFLYNNNDSDVVLTSGKAPTKETLESVVMNSIGEPMRRNEALSEAILEKRKQRLGRSLLAGLGFIAVIILAGLFCLPSYKWDSKEGYVSLGCNWGMGLWMGLPLLVGPGLGAYAVYGKRQGYKRCLLIACLVLLIINCLVCFSLIVSTSMTGITRGVSHNKRVHAHLNSQAHFKYLDCLHGRSANDDVTGSSIQDIKDRCREKYESNGVYYSSRHNYSYRSRWEVAMSFFILFASFANFITSIVSSALICAYWSAEGDSKSDQSKVVVVYAGETNDPRFKNQL